MKRVVLQALSLATVRICKSDGERLGQGLCVAIPGAPPLVLTCYHVVAALEKKDQIPIDLFSASDVFLRQVTGRYLAERSDPERDIAVLAFSEDVEASFIKMAQVSPSISVRRPVVGIVRPNFGSQRFNATLAESTPLSVRIGSLIVNIPSVFRLIEATNVQPGISGSPIVLGDSVIGLVHFSREESGNFSREGYGVPIDAWFSRNPELAALTTPYAEAVLANSAIVRSANDLDPEADLALLGYEENVVFETDLVQRTIDLLSNKRRCLVIGRPLSGKTWTAYRAARRWQGVVVIPIRDAPPDDFDKSSLSEEPVLLLIDAVPDKEVNFNAWRRALSDADARKGVLPPAVLLTSRDGSDWSRVKRSLPDVYRQFNVENGDGCVFTSRVGKRGQDVDWESARTLARNLGIKDQDFARRFDGTIGSIRLDLVAMKSRYDELRGSFLGNVQASRLLDSLKFLATIHSPLTEENARSVAERIRGDGSLTAEQWDELRRSTAEAAFGFFDGRSLFRTYLSYLDECVRYEPSADDLNRYASFRLEKGDAWGLLATGIKLDQLDDPRGIEALAQAATLGSVSALRGILLLLGAEHRESLPYAIKVTHELIRRGKKDFFDTLGTLYFQWGKRRLAERAYRRGIQAGERHAERNLAGMLFGDPNRRAEGQALLRKVVSSDPTPMSSFSLGTSLMEDLGSELETERMFLQSEELGFVGARLFLGCFYIVWPGHRRDGKALLEAVIDNPDEWDASSIWIATESLKLDASLSEDEAAYDRFARRQLEVVKELSQSERPMRSLWTARTTRANPTTFDDTPNRNADSVLASAFRSRFELPTPTRHELLSCGWDRAWAVQADLPNLLNEYDELCTRGYVQAELIRGATLYRLGEHEAAGEALRLALKAWSSDDRHSVRGWLLLASIAVLCGDREALALHGRAAATAYSSIANAEEASRFLDLVGVVSNVFSMPNAAPGGALHRQLSLLWLCLDEIGPAWFEDLRWKTAVRPEAFRRFGRGMGAALIGGSAQPSRLNNELANRLSKNSGRGPVVLRIAEVSPPMLITAKRQGDQLILSSTWLRVTGGPAARSQFASILLRMGMFIDSNDCSVRLETRLDEGAPERDQLAIYLELFVGSLVNAGKLLSSPFGMRVAFKIVNTGEAAGIDVAFETATAREAVDSSEVILKAAEQISPFAKAAAHQYLAERYLSLDEGSRAKNVSVAVDHLLTALQNCPKKENPFCWAALQTQLGHLRLERREIGTAVQCFRAALSVCTREAHPFEWANLQAAIAHAHITGLPDSGDAQAISTAIACCKSASDVFSQIQCSIEWAHVQECLGRAYLGKANRADEDPARRHEAIAAATSCFRDALEINTRDVAPYRWAALQSYLGTCYFVSRLVVEPQDQRETVGRAILCFEAASEVFTEEEFPGDWAIVQATLGDAYLAQSAWLPTSREEANGRWDAALRKLDRQVNPLLWAAVHLALARTPRSQTSIDMPQGLVGQIDHFRAAAGVFAEKKKVVDPLRRADLYRDLGHAYSRLGDYDPPSLQDAIKSYHQSLAILKNTSPERRAALNDFIGNCCLRLQHGSLRGNLDKAVKHCEEALQVYTRKRFPFDWAQVQENLGRIHLARWQYDPTAVNQAIRHHVSALEVFTRDSRAFAWAANTDYLGVCYRLLQHGDRRQNIEKAIELCALSLDVFEVDAYPADAAVALQNTGWAHLEARVIHGTYSLRSAAALFDLALELIDQGRDSKLWACLQQCFGIAFQEIAKAEKEVASLEQSETCLSKSLTILNNNAFPLDWASVQYELGLTHVLKSSMGVDGASERAMEFFDSACTVFRRKEQRRKWALVQNGIACAHRESLPSGDIPRLEKAISLHLEAMDELTPAAFPQDRADVEFDLAITRKRLGAIKGDSEQQALASRNFANVLNFYTASLFPYQWTQIASEADMSGRLAST